MRSLNPHVSQPPAPVSQTDGAEQGRQEMGTVSMTPSLNSMSFTRNGLTAPLSASPCLPTR